MNIFNIFKSKQTKKKEAQKKLFEYTKDILSDMEDINKIKQQMSSTTQHNQWKDIESPEEFRLHHWALHYSMIGDLEKAIKYSTEGLKLNPKNAYFLYLRGRTKGDIGQFTEGIKDLNEALILNPIFSDVFVERGVIKQAMGDIKGAAEDYEKAKEIEPTITFPEFKPKLKLEEKDLFPEEVIFRDTVYIIKIKNPIPYPAEKENRRTIFGDPLSSIFGLNFDDIAIEYFKDSENRLYEIAVACFKSKVKYKNEDEMPELNAKLFKLYSAYVSEFFEGINIEAEIVNVCLPSNSKISIADYAIERMNSQKENAGREVIEEKEFIPAIIKSSETGKIDLIGKIGGKLNYSEYRYDETTTIHKSEDGRYFAGLISKKDGNRYYAEIPEEEGRKLLSETK